MRLVALHNSGCVSAACFPSFLHAGQPRAALECMHQGTMPNWSQARQAVLDGLDPRTCCMQEAWVKAVVEGCMKSPQLCVQTLGCRRRYLPAIRSSGKGGTVTHPPAPFPPGAVMLLSQTCQKLLRLGYHPRAAPVYDSAVAGLTSKLQGDQPSKEGPCHPRQSLILSQSSCLDLPCRHCSRADRPEKLLPQRTA